MTVKDLYEMPKPRPKKVVFVVHGSYSVDTSDILGTFSDEATARKYVSENPPNSATGGGYHISKLVLDGLQSDLGEDDE